MKVIAFLGLLPFALAAGDTCGTCTRAQRHLVAGLHQAIPATDVLVAAKKFRGDIKNMCSDAPDNAHSGAYEVLMSEATTAAVSGISSVAEAHCPKLSGAAERKACMDIASNAPRLHGPRGMVMTDLLLQNPLSYAAESETCALMGRCGEIASVDAVPAVATEGDLLVASRGDGWKRSRRNNRSVRSANSASRSSFLSAGSSTGTSDPEGNADADVVPTGAGVEESTEIASTDGLSTTTRSMPKVRELPLLPGAERLGVGYSSYGRYLSPQTIFKMEFSNGDSTPSMSTWRNPGSNSFYFASKWYKVPDHLSVIPCAAFEQGFRASEVFDRDARSGSYGGSADVGVSDMGDVFGANGDASGSHEHSVARESDEKLDDKLIVMSKYAVQARMAMDFPVEELNPAFVRDLRAAEGYGDFKEYVSSFFGVWGDKVVSRRIFGGVIREHSSDDRSSETYGRTTSGSGSVSGSGVAEGMKINGGVAGRFTDTRSEEHRATGSQHSYSIYGGPPGLSGELPSADLSTLNTLFNAHPYAIVSCSADVTTFIPRTAEFRRARQFITEGITKARQNLSAFRRAYDDVTDAVSRVKDAYRVIKDYDNRAVVGAHEKLTGTKLKAVLNRCESLKRKVATARAKLQNLVQIVGSNVGELYLEGLLEGENACDQKIAHWDAYPSDFTKRSIGWCLGSSTFWRCTPGTE